MQVVVGVAGGGGVEKMFFVVFHVQIELHNNNTEDGKERKKMLITMSVQRNLTIR